MREDSFVRKKIKNSYFSTYKLTGLNLDSLIKSLKRNGLNIYYLKKTGNRELLITVKASENKKFFAILNKVWYNENNKIVKIKDGGKLYPILKLFQSFGIILGAIFFVIISVFMGNTVLDISYSGSGEIVKEEVGNYLLDIGIKKFSLFSDINLKKLEDDILKSNDNLSFVSCEKIGSTLSVFLVLSEEKVKTLNGNERFLKSSVDGEIEKIKVYRGTPLLKEGDFVKKGDVIVDGYAEIKDEKISVGVIAEVSLKVKFSFECVLDGENQEEKAIVFALEELGEKDVLDEKAVLIDKNSFRYRVEITYRQVIFTG